METSKQEWSDFERAWTERTIDSINLIREAADLTVKSLATRLRNLGWPISDATLSGMLSGNKRGSISIAEVTVFARALNVSPLYFILGLPRTRDLPPSKLWGDLPPASTRMLDWFTKSMLLEPYPGDDLSRGDKDSPAYFASTFASQGLGDLDNIAEAMRIISWQAAQIVAFSKFDKATIEDTFPKEVWGQDYLWAAIARLSGARHAQRQMGEWGLQLYPLPELLSFIDAEPHEEREDFSLEELMSIAPPHLVARAITNTKEAIERRQESIPQSERGLDGSPA